MLEKEVPGRAHIPMMYTQSNNRNDCSRSIRIGVHVGPEYAEIIERIAKLREEDANQGRQEGGGIIRFQ